MSDKINSFNETVNKLVEQTNIALEFAVKTNKSFTTQENDVTMSIQEYDEVTGDPSTVTYQIPAYNAMIAKVDNAVASVDTFVKGQGKILLKDGTYREVKTFPVPISPTQISDMSSPINFKAKNNWFFEDLLFPKLVVTFDLKGKIDDRSDRIVVRRVIFNNSDDTETQWFKDNIIGQDLSYFETITKLNENNKEYWQDDETLDLPLSTEPYTGYFSILDKRTVSGKIWFYLDTLNYGIPSDSPVVKNLELSQGNFLRFNNSIYKVSDINVSEKRVQLTAMTGFDHPSVNKSFEIYNSPFSSKLANVAIGYDECNAMFLKGVNDDYNIIADDWSKGIMFYSNDLILEDNILTLEEYYNQYVSDFGKQMEGAAKEKFIPAFFGVIPDSPVLKDTAFKVTQINTQLNAALDTEEIKNSQTQIESTKTIISSLKNTIAQQKAELVTITDNSQREDLNSKIAINVRDLAERTVEYQSLVRSLSTLAYESDAVNANPKYRLRGFYDIPTGKSNSTSAPLQEIIQFEIAYRYLKLDNTGTNLTSYDNIDTSTGKIKRGVFSDWTITTSPIKERVYDTSANSYSWVQPSIADGDEVNINQIDIPIRKGEKVEYKVRSISEAGWPTNPKKSEWSDTIIKEFPANLSGSDQVTNILSDAISEESQIKLDETLRASGIITHIADSIPNPNAGDGTYFKHQAVNLAYDLSEKSEGGIIAKTSTTDVQSILSNLGPNTYVTLTRPPGVSAAEGAPHLTGTLQLLMQAIVNADPSIYEEFETLIP